jgi:hypothetical protein
MAILKGINLALAFLLELVMLFAFGYWGFQTGDSTIIHVIFGLGLPVIAIIIWSIYNAPQSKRRLPRTPRTILEVVMFGLGALALAAAGQIIFAVIFIVVVLINQLLLYVWQQ